MFNDVMQRFLSDPIEGDFNGTGQPAGNIYIDSNVKLGTPGYACRQETDCRNPAEIIQDGGAKFVRITPELISNLVQQFLDRLQLISLPLGQRAADIRKRQVYGNKQLARLIMDGIGNAPDLF